MVWNWQLSEWPQFARDRQKLAAREASFLEQAGVLIGASRHISDDDRISLSVSVMSMEAIDTSQIEGETLDRESVQSSIQRTLGLKASQRTAPPAESGIAEMMVDLLKTTGDPVSDTMLQRCCRACATAWRQISSASFKLRLQPTYANQLFGLRLKFL
jgi:Fic family protein